MQPMIFRAAFFILFLTYGILGSPTPDSIGAAEILMGLCLITLASKTPYRMITGQFPLRENISALSLLSYGLLIGLTLAAFSAPENMFIIKDVIAFLFLLLPFWLQPHNTHQYKEDLLKLCTFIGVAFTLRYYMDVFEYGALIGLTKLNQDLLYLANSPFVIFTSFYALYKAHKHFISDNITLIRFIFWLLISLITLSAMWFMQQRASFALYGLYVMALVIISLKKKPYRSLIIVTLLSLSAWLLKDFGSLIIDPFIEKTRLTGTNMRIAEWQAVLDSTSSSLINILLGLGWGASFSSPAVGEWYITFTHSLLSSMWLKLGLIGFILTLFYLVKILKYFWRTNKTDKAYIYAVIAPFFIGCFLYANFKSLGFGAILWLMMMPHEKEQK